MSIWRGSYRGYNYFDLIYLSICWLRTKLFWRPARLIRFPIQVRNQGAILGAKGFVTGRYCRIDVFQNGLLEIGEGVEINDGCHIACAGLMKIADGTLIASRVFITDHDHSSENFEDLVVEPVCIGKHCWIGENVSILKGITLGDNSVVGANSVVTKSFPPNSILVGCPAVELPIKKSG